MKPKKKLEVSRHKRKPRPRQRFLKGIEKSLSRQLLALLVIILLGTGAVAVILQYQPFSEAEVAQPDDGALSHLISQDIRTDLQKTRQSIAQILDSQINNGVTVVKDDEIQQQLSTIAIDLKVHNTAKARRDLRTLEHNTTQWKTALDVAIAKKKAEEARATAAKPVQVPVKTTAAGWQVPILLYHKTPVDFEAQLQSLVAKGYTTIDLDQLLGAMSGGNSLPRKPVVITFDDGFYDQLNAFSLLRTYNMKATFYIIDGGSQSNWCIGANRHDGLACGDAYLTWADIRMLDRSGIITIGSHTIDHTNLASLTADEQRYEIVSGKTQLESEIGHPIRHFAYPYGSYNATSLAIVRDAGFVTAVTTLPGLLQAKGTQYTLHRTRSVYALP